MALGPVSDKPANFPIPKKFPKHSILYGVHNAHSKIF